jgi:hypothetical protein
MTLLNEYGEARVPHMIRRTKRKHDKMLGLYESLKHSDRVEVVFDSSIRAGAKKVLQVTSAHRVVGKKKIGRIIFKDPDNLKGCKFFWYNREGRISMAIGNMGVWIVDANLKETK